MNDQDPRAPYRAYLAKAAALAAQLPSGESFPAAPRRVGIIGAGTMGIGIALSCLHAGLEVLLFDSSQDAQEQAVKTIGGELLRAEAKGRLARSADETIVLLSCAESLAEFSDRDVVVEAVFENREAKRAIFAELDAVCRPGCLLGTNTSTIDIDLIASATTRPADVVGLHFFSPAQIMPLLEIVRGSATPPATVAQALAFARSIGKTAVVVGSCYGFAANRMGEGYVREAMRLLLEGATPRQIDAAITGFGMPMGPCAMTDSVGIDVPYRARQENSQAEPGDTTYYRIADLLVESGRHGQKSGAGFYRYASGSRLGEDDPEVLALAIAEAGRLGITRRTIGDDEIVDRCILSIVNEGFKVVDEGIAERASDLDVIYSAGFGFPAAHGGPMIYAQTRGLTDILGRIREFEKLYGSYYWGPAPLLVALAQSGGRVVDAGAEPAA